jgi:hypothetical protein
MANAGVQVKRTAVPMWRCTAAKAAPNRRAAVALGKSAALQAVQ